VVYDVAMANTNTMSPCS